MLLSRRLSILRWRWRRQAVESGRMSRNARPSRWPLNLIARYRLSRIGLRRTKQTKGKKIYNQQGLTSRTPFRITRKTRAFGIVQRRSRRRVQRRNKRRRVQRRNRRGVQRRNRRGVQRRNRRRVHANRRSRVGPLSQGVHASRRSQWG